MSKCLDGGELQSAHSASALGVVTEAACAGCGVRHQRGRIFPVQLHQDAEGRSAPRPSASEARRLCPGGADRERVAEGICIALGACSDDRPSTGHTL